MSEVKGLKERLIDGETVICAEGYLLELERRGFVTLGDYTPEVVLDHPERVKALSEEFVWAGSDVVEAFTYYGHRDKMKRIGREDDLERLNLQALKIAKEVADAHGCLVAGGLSNTWVFDSASQEKLELAEAMFKEQIEWAVKGGADYMIAESIAELEEAKLALKAIQKYGNGFPAVVTLLLYNETTTFEGTPVLEALAQLEQCGADVVGLNCSLGPENMLPILEKAKKTCKGPLAALPVPIRTSKTVRTMYNARDPLDGKPLYPSDLNCIQCKRSEVRKFGERARDLGIQYIGLCCGSSPSMIRELAQAYGRNPPAAKFAPNLSHSVFQRNESTLTEQEKEYRGKALGEDYDVVV